MQRQLTAATLGLLLSGALGATESSPNPLLGIFQITCVDHLDRFDQLPGFMERTGAVALDPSQSGPFLLVSGGTAWAIPVDPGNYVVSLREDGMCSAYARTGDTTVIERDFRAFAGTAPAPFVSTAADAPVANPSDLGAVAYDWTGSRQDQAKIHFRLTYSRKPDAPIRALVSLAVGDTP